MAGNDSFLPTLHIEALSRGPAAFWLTLRGEADIATAARLDEALARVSLLSSQSCTST